MALERQKEIHETKENLMVDFIKSLRIKNLQL